MATFDCIRHRTLHINGINMHIAESGARGDPIILFVHGFPELWYSWRYQMVALSALGYHTVAPDMRGYGDTDVPPDPRSYTYTHVVGDLVALIDELGASNVFVVGHDWGAMIAWWLCIFRPDRVKALVNMSVAFAPRNPKIKPTDMFRAAYGDDFYICRFQVLGEIEGEIDEAGGADKLLRKVYSGRDPGPIMLPKGQAFKEMLPYPNWLSDAEASYYRDMFTKTGFAGGLNYYRALDLSWELTAPWTGAQVNYVPVKFIVGDLDPTYNSPGIKEYIHQGGMKKDVPLLQDIVILEGVAHFLQQEKPDLVTNHIYDFIKKF